MADNRAGDLSGGQKRKLCILLSLLGDPPIVTMDEPTAGVDVQSRQTIWKKIASLSDTTTIVTSHALEEAEAVCSRMFIVTRGHLAFQGTSTELRNKYKCGYVLRVETSRNLNYILPFVQQIIPEAQICGEANDFGDSITMPVCDAVPELVRQIEQNKESLEITTYTFSVEQLEDTLIKMMDSEEA